MSGISSRPWRRLTADPQAAIGHDGGVTDYTGFARFYDRIMGDRDEEIARIRTYISKYLPGARSLLELGCGTGALLAGLDKSSG